MTTCNNIGLLISFETQVPFDAKVSKKTRNVLSSMSNHLIHTSNNDCIWWHDAVAKLDAKESAKSVGLVKKQVELVGLWQHVTTPSDSTIPTKKHKSKV